MRSDLFVSAGEASSDLHASKVVAALRAAHPGLSVFGIGGSAVKEQGTEIVVSASELSLFGITNLVSRAPEIWSAYRRLVAEIEKRRPRCALLLDMPDLNLRLAKHLKAQGTKVIYYISPQVWVWRKYRLKKIQKLVDKMLVVFPFEKKFYEAHGVSAEFVGHPLLESLPPRSAYRSQAEIQRAPRIALLPGSRSSEIEHHLSTIDETAKKLKQIYPAAELRVPVPPTLSVDKIKARLDVCVQVQNGGATQVMEWADVALVASGTATLECALVGTPLALFYEVSPWNAFVFRRFIRYRGPIGMPNILLGEEAITECFQQDAKPENLVAEIRRLIDDEPRRTALSRKLRQCRELLGAPGASRLVAERVQAFL